MTQAKRSIVPLNTLVVEGLFVRQALNDDHVYHLATLYEAGVKLPPLLVSRADNRVIDGRHRHKALELAGKTAVEVEWEDETDRAILLSRALKANIGGALPPTNADIVLSMRLMLEAGMVASAVGKQFDKVWPPSVIRRYVTDAQSQLNQTRVLHAKNAVAEGGMTVNEAAMAYKVKPDTLKAALVGKGKRRKATSEIKGTLANVFRSRGGSFGQIMRRVQQRYEDGDLTWKSIEEILDYCEKASKATLNSVSDWRKRFEAVNGKAK